MQHSSNKNTPENVKKAKKPLKELPGSIQVLLALMMGLTLAVLLALAIVALRTPGEGLTPDELQNDLTEYYMNRKLYIQLSDVNDGCYETEINEEFLSTIAVDKWRRQFRKPAGEEKLILRVLDRFWVFFSDGSVGAYGLVRKGDKSTVYYKIPDGITDQLIHYIKTNGTLQAYGEPSVDREHFEYYDYYSRWIY